ncbi:MAG: hypothetical protein CMJ31_10590 [Phycisphaerae bacterium]|nr:hypothetical protein [Phycisphaerae bacterium]
MVRTHAQHPIAKAILPATILALIVLAVLPASYLRWTTGLSQLVRAAVTPISHPLIIVSRWLSPADQGRESDRIETLEAEARTYELRWRQGEQEIKELRQLVEELQSGRALPQKIPIDYVAAPVIGTASDVASGALIVRRGERDGVTEQSTVATTAGTQLVGRVVKVDARTCVVLPITDRAAGTDVRAEIVVDNAAAKSQIINCILFPDDTDGRLGGLATVLNPTASDPDPPTPRPGMTVRLSDPGWPTSSQQLVLGVIEEIRPDEANPLRPWIVVAPTVELRRLGQVILLIPIDAGDARGGGAP